MNDITFITDTYIEKVNKIVRNNKYKIKCNIDTIEELKAIIELCSSWTYKDKEKEECKYCYKYTCDECIYN